MATAPVANTAAAKEFRNVSEAIRVLRTGRKDDRWYSAAEFLISRATPEVTLMLDVGKELGRKSEQAQQAGVRRPIPWKWGLAMVVLVTVAILSGYLLAEVVGGICAS
jgi:hypothetical protein